MIGVVNYLIILHYLVSFYPVHLYNYDFSIQELKVGSYDEVWNVREDAPLYEGSDERSVSYSTTNYGESGYFISSCG